MLIVYTPGNVESCFARLCAVILFLHFFFGERGNLEFPEDLS